MNRVLRCFLRSLALRIPACLLIVLATAEGQERRQGDLIRYSRVSTGQIGQLRIDSDGERVAVLEVSPYDLSIRSLAGDEEFRATAHTSIRTRDFCFADSGTTLLIGGQNLKTWNWRLGSGRVIDGDRNPEFVISDVVAANHRTGQIAAAGRTSLFLASDSTGKDGRWRDVPALRADFTEDGKYLVVQCPDRLCLYESRAAELGVMTAIRELDPATKRITSEVVEYNRKSGKMQTARVTRGAITSRENSSICVHENVVFASFFTEILHDDQAKETHPEWAVEICGHRDAALQSADKAVSDCCLIAKGFASHASVCTIGAGANARVYLVELSPITLSLMPISLSVQGWECGPETSIRIDMIPGDDEAKTGGAACFAISKQRNSILIGYFGGYLAEWQL